MATSNPPQPLADDRRDDVVRATCAVIAREGLDRTSMRAIAHELGSTTGVLTHYFRDKSALLAFVFEAIVNKLQLDSAIPDDPAVTLDEVGETLRRYLPHDADSAVWWKVWLSFTVAALANPREAERHRALYARIRAIWVATLTAMQQGGTLDPSLDPALEADGLICFADGVGVQALIAPEAMGAARQAELIDAYIRKLAPARPR